MEKPSKMNLAFKWGGIMGVVSVIFSLLMYLTGMVDEETGQSGALGTIVSLAITVIFIYMAIAEYKKSNFENLSIGDGAVMGILTGLVAGVISAIYVFIFMGYIAPDLLETIREAQLAQMDGMSNAQEEQAVKMMDLFTSPGMMALFSLIGSIIFCLIIGFVLGLIMKNENPNAPLAEME